MNRLMKSGIVTTIIGTITLIFCMMMLWFGKANTTDLAGWLAFALAMIRAKDTILGINEKKD